MKKLSVCLMLVAGINGKVFAQQKTAMDATDKVFDVPAETLTRRFYIDLGKGNSMRLELSNMADISRVQNIDSLLAVFFTDLSPFRDSLANELSAKKIDYVIDGFGRKKIRIRQTAPDGSSFLLRRGEVSILRITQDTINIIGSVDMPAKLTLHKPFANVRYYRVSFFVNDFNDLRNEGPYITQKIGGITDIKKSRWKIDKSGDWHIIKADEAISAKSPGGYISGSTGYLTSVLSADIQNYKNYFIPSFAAGLKFVFNNGKVKRNLTLAEEFHFLFAKNATGTLQTFRNDFLSLSYSQANDISRSGYYHLNPNISLGYLTRNSGNVYDKNTFRLGISQFTLFDDKVKIEPVFYFHDFFRNVTPGIRFSISL